MALTADGQLVACGSFDGTVRLWEANTGTSLRILRPERRYEHLDITGLTGITAAQRAALLASGAIEQHAPVASRPPGCRWSRCGKTRARFGRGSVARVRRSAPTWCTAAHRDWLPRLGTATGHRAHPRQLEPHPILHSPVGLPEGRHVLAHSAAGRLIGWQLTPQRTTSINASRSVAARQARSARLSNAYGPATV